MPTSNTRKRPSPGSIPIQPPMSQPYTNPDHMMRWSGNNTGNFGDNNSTSLNPYTIISPTQSQFNQGTPTPSTVLARRTGSNALIASNRTFSPQAGDAWPGFDDNLLSAQPSATLDEHDNIELLEEKAQRAKREAQAKRKQIPPFVQKLNSFLEDGKNTDLIRWSDKGDSFIVLDEDEFAKTLIPELFKHNNYASFVRQLNMYGFHKKVGLSDNSMKASERKNKSPSEYYNPYFRRGHPILLWLINKPKSNAKKGKRRPDEGDGESDDDATPVDDTGAQPFSQANVPNRALPAAEVGPLQKKELALVRDQMTALQRGQKQISDAITRLRHEHNQLFNQAMMFQNMHNRHENSINAILNFLANVFRKSLEEQGGTQNVNDLLATIIPNVQMPSQGQGSVVDLDDWVQQHIPANPPKTGTPKRAQRLLPGIPQNQAPTHPSMAQPASSYHDFASGQRPPGKVTELHDAPTSESNRSSYLKHELENNPQEGMLKLIQDANSNAGKAGNALSDLSHVAANTAANMTNDQRDRMLSMMSGGQSNTASVQTPSSSSPGVTPSATPGGTSFGVPTPGVRPTTSPMSPAIPPALPAAIQRMNQTEEELEQLQRLQREQSQKLEDLSTILGPLSPSGRIPGLEDQSEYFPDDIDITQYLDPNAYIADSGGNDFNFDTANFADNSNLDWHPEMTDVAGGSSSTNPRESSGIVDTNTPYRTPSHRSPSPSGTEEITREDFEDSPGRAMKRQRRT
ncbi:hypothetical protein GGS20DRAFT_476113 [Poronia punctata]|nr:hypothetical protein GGS20DRAFT_476113 [Poronia punctata]